MKRITVLLSVLVLCFLIPATSYADVVELPFVPIEDISGGEQNELPIISPTDDTEIGDMNGDGFVDASDASDVLGLYAQLSTDSSFSLTEKQLKYGDVDENGSVDASDASAILGYYAYASTGGTDSFDKFISDLR